MIQNGLQTAEKLSDQALTGTVSRLFFIDHLRAALVILVVLHHVAIVYGEGVSFYYVEPPKNESLGQLILVLFVLFNQAWFMGAFFLIAGYFTPGSFDRKAPGFFLKDRLVRLGIPLVVFIFVLNPISAIGFFLMPPSLTGITDPLTWQTYPYLLGLGVAWFLAMLLIFSFGYAAWRMLTRNRTSSSVIESSSPGYVSIAIFILVLALVTYLFRIIIPMGKDVLDFPTLSYLPQYLSIFVLGAIAYRRNWIQTLPGSMGVAGFVAALVATVLLFPIPLLGMLGGTFRFLGNGTWPSAVYALWDTIFAVGMCLAAITFFRRFFNKESKFGSFLSQQSYAVFLIHSPIIVFLAYALRGVVLGPILKFGMVSIIVIPTCFAVAYIIRKIPGVTKVL